MIDLRDRHRILHEVLLQLWTTAGHVITRNPTDLDADGSHLTLYAAPEDSGEIAGTQILVYEAGVTPLNLRRGPPATHRNPANGRAGVRAWQ